MGLSCVGSGSGAGMVRAGSGRESARRRMRGRLAVVLTTVNAALLVLVGGCTAGPPVPEQTFAEYTPTSTPTPVLTPSPTAVPVVAPIRPAGMQRTDEAGAVAAATYFMELYSYVLRTGDHVEWDQVGIADCVFCSGTREDVDRIYGVGGRITGGALTLGTPELLVFDPGIGVYAISVPYAFASGAEENRVGDLVEPYAAKDGDLVLEVMYSARGWTLVGGSRGEVGQS